MKCFVTSTGRWTYRYGRDAYMVEPVISSRVTWRDYSIKRKKKEKTFPHEQNNEGFEWLNRAWHLLPFYTSLSGPFVAGNFAATILERFAFKRIGISVTQEQQQMPAYVHAPVHCKNKSAWSWGGNFNSNIQRRPIIHQLCKPRSLIQENCSSFFKVSEDSNGCSQKGCFDIFNNSLLPIQTMCEFVTWHSGRGPFVSLDNVNIFLRAGRGEGAAG